MTPDSWGTASACRTWIWCPCRPLRVQIRRFGSVRICRWLTDWRGQVKLSHPAPDQPACRHEMTWPSGETLRTSDSGGIMRLCRQCKTRSLGTLLCRWGLLSNHKFQNALQDKTGRNMVKSRNPKAPSTLITFFCPRTHASPQTCHHFASSLLAVRIVCRIFAVFVFRKPLFTLIMAPKIKSTNVCSAYKPKRSHNVLFVNEKVKLREWL